MATIETRKRQIENDFREHKTLFDFPLTQVEMRSTPGKNVSVIYVPRDISLNNPNEGLPLKDGIGFLSVKEEVDNNGNRIGYLYRFTSDEYTYIAAKKDSCQSDLMEYFFNFHYQKDPRHEGPHISFLHPSIPYISRDISLSEFLGFLKRTFFIDGLRKNSLPWHSHF
jgi:hypothetical protein